MICPEDKKVLRSIAIDKYEVDVCDTCKGIWLDEIEMRKIADTFAWNIPQETATLIPLVAKNVGGERPEKEPLDAQGGPCPVDGTPLTHFVYSGDSGITLDRCEKCFGIWFDGDELAHMAEYLKPSWRDMMGKLIILETKERIRMQREFEDGLLDIITMFRSFSPPLAVLALLLIIIRKVFELEFKDWLWKKT